MGIGLILFVIPPESMTVGVVDCWGTVGLVVVGGARMGAFQRGKDRNIFRINKL